MKIAPVLPSESSLISALCFRSKAYWGYSEEQMEKWRNELRCSSEYILKNKVYKLTIEDRIIAFYSYYFLDTRSVFMDNLFVDPDFIGKGLGKILMDDFLIKIMSAGKNRILLHADPNAEAFYLKRGFTTIGQEPTSIPGRFMPIMELQL